MLFSKCGLDQKETTQHKEKQKSNDFVARVAPTSCFRFVQRPFNICLLTRPDGIAEFLTVHTLLRHVQGKKTCYAVCIQACLLKDLLKEDISTRICRRAFVFLNLICSYT